MLQVGTIQPISDICASVWSHAKVLPLFHTDAAQSLGKVAVDVKGLGVDMATIVGHKFGAPKGVAALYIRWGMGNGKTMTPLQSGVAGKTMACLAALLIMLLEVC